MSDTPDPSSLVSQDEAAAELLGGTTPSAGEEAKSEPTLEEVAARVEAELAAESSDGKPDEPKSKLKELIDTKYGGDEEKFVSGMYEQWNSTARLKKELDEVKAVIANASRAPEPEPPPPAEAPDVKWLDKEIAALDGEAQQNSAAQQALVVKAEQIKADIHELRGEMKNAETVEKHTLEEKISRKEAELERKADQWQRLNERNRRIDHEKRDFGRQKDLAVREVELSRAQLQQQKQDLRNYQEDQGRVFNTALQSAVAEYQLPTADPEYMQYLDETIRAKVSFILRNDPEGGPVDLAALAKAQVAGFAKAHNLSKKAAFTQKTQEKLQATHKAPVSPAKPASPAAAPTPASPKRWTADFARQRAAKILGG